MTVSNHTVVALGILTRSAKQRFGIFKVSDILNNNKLAFELLTKSILSGDHGLMSLAAELNKSLKIEPHLINALHTYIQHIEHNNQNDHFISKSLACLKNFVNHLDDIELDSTAYRQASNHFLQASDKKDYLFCVNLIRSFYPFWSRKGNALSKAPTQYDLIPQSKNLILLWSSLDSSFLTAIEESLLNIYIIAIKKINIKDEELELRIKIVKLILIKQRLFDKTTNGYRQNICQLNDYFSNDSLLEYVLSVSREFYTVWLDLQVAKVSTKQQIMISSPNSKQTTSLPLD